MPVAGSQHHAKSFRLKDGDKRPSLIIDAMKVVDWAELGRGALGALFGTLGVRGKERVRKLRKDARTNRCALLKAILAHTDIASGVVVSESPTPLPDGRHYLVPMSAETLTKKAYGEIIEDEISIERTARGLRDLRDLGLIELTQQSEKLRNGDILNLPSVKAVSESFWSICRLSDKLAKVRGKKASETAVKRLQAILAGVARRQGRRRAERAVTHQTRGAVNGTAEARAAAAAYRKKAAAMGMRPDVIERSVKAYMSRWKPGVG